MSRGMLFGLTWCMVGPEAEEDPIESFWEKIKVPREPEPVAPIPVKGVTSLDLSANLRGVVWDGASHMYVVNTPTGIPVRESDVATQDYVDGILAGQPQPDPNPPVHPIQTVVTSLAAIGVPCNISMTDGLHEERTVTLTFNPYAGYPFDTNVEYTQEGGVALTFTFSR